MYTHLKMLQYCKNFAGLYFREFHDKIPIRENIFMNMLFPYISTDITYLVHEKLNAKILLILCYNVIF